MSEHDKKPLVLFILDGWGHSDHPQHNPCQQANTPYIKHLFASHPHRLLDASGTAVGLPDGQIGNSEVGHLHIGAGRLLKQDLTRITDGFADHSIADNTVLQQALATAKADHSRFHLLGLLSPGGVHSHEQHILAMLKLLNSHGVTTCLHAFLDGRDVPPKSALTSLDACTELLAQLDHCHMGSVAGRFYAMDRDQRWERVAKAYDCLVGAEDTPVAASAQLALAQAYANNETDEFVSPTRIANQQINTSIDDGDVVIFMNFRADRARQLCSALIEPNFTQFVRKRQPKLKQLITLTQYAKGLEADVLFPPYEVKATLGDTIAEAGMTQLRLAETEKYAHVTYFFNGGNETPLPGETRTMIASPKVATYDLAPTMSANELTDALVSAISSGAYDVIICNYANPDMVGHTGNEAAATQAMEAMDACLKRAIDALIHVGGCALVTADHGNVECMYDPETEQPHTAHTTNQVPLIFIGDHGQFDEQPASLVDIAPTILKLLNIPKPKEMTGRELLHC